MDYVAQLLECLHNERSLVRFPVNAETWVVGSIPGLGANPYFCLISMFRSLPISSYLSKINKNMFCFVLGGSVFLFFKLFEAL